MFISRYKVSLEYGGPEEGGWYYDWFEFLEPVLVVADSDLTADMLRTIVSAMAEHEEGVKREFGERPRHSVIGTPDTIYMVEETLGEHSSEERPVYM
jgi:hypothetical protein